MTDSSRSPQVGDTITTKTGKFPAVVLAVNYASTPAEAATLLAAVERNGGGRMPRRRDSVDYRTLRNGKPFGPVRRASFNSITISEGNR